MYGGSGFLQCVSVCVSVCLCVCAQSCPTLCDPEDYSPPGSSVHRIPPEPAIKAECICNMNKSYGNW